MGELGDGTMGRVGDQIAKACPQEEANPHIFLFDEFQFNRSIREDGHELQNKPSRVIWQLLDDGRIPVVRTCDFRIGALQSMIKNFSYWVNRGLTLNDGMVPPEFSDFFDGSETEEEEEPVAKFVFNMIELHSLLMVYDPRFENLHHLKSYIKGLNVDEIFEFINDALDRSSKPKWLDFSKSLFFIAGNLDEVYHLSKDQSPDVSPDEFHRSSLEIKLPHVKKALLKRFRSEQIARLGNNHIIYPSLSSAAFNLLIDAELKSIAFHYSQKAGLNISFETGVKEWVFKEGVVPTQGVRPLKSTIRYGVEDQMPKILSKIQFLEKEVDQIMIDINGGFEVRFMLANEVVDKSLYPLTEKVCSLKRNRNDDMQAIVAVHEAGHAVVHMSLFQELPVKILSVLADAESNGMIICKPINIFSLEVLRKEISGLFGGYEAEALIYGVDLVSPGSAGDIEKATNLTMSLFKNNGFGGELIRVAEFAEQYEHNYHNLGFIEDKVRVFLKEARKIARQILEKERRLLIEMARHLAQNTSLSQEEISSFVDEFGTQTLKNALKSRLEGYREQLFSRELDKESLESFSVTESECRSN